MVYCTPCIIGENKRSRSLFSYDVSVFYLEGEMPRASRWLRVQSPLDLRIQKTKGSLGMTSPQHRQVSAF
jgi:hypothetical protein